MESSTNKKRKAFSIEEKAIIINKFESGITNSSLAKEYKVSHSTISTICKNRNVIQKAFETQKIQTKKLRYSKNCDIEESLLKWFIQQRNKNVPISGPILKTKADEIGKLLNKDFKCTESWIFRFRQRHNIVLGKLSGESAEVNQGVLDEWIASVWPKIRVGYTASEIYNIDETGLFYKMTPEKTFKFRGEKCVGGKLSKERITLLVGANMDGSDKKKLLVISKSKSPRCFKHIKALPVEYTGNKKAWMTSEIFEGYLRKWDAELIKKKRKILLLVDNCPSHPHIKNLKAIKLTFLPPNTSSVSQPMDQGVIKSLKDHYRRNLLLKLVRNLDSGQNTVVTLIDAVEMVATAWDRVTSQTVANCFKHAGLVLESDTDIESDLYDENDEIPLSVLTQLSPFVAAHVQDKESWNDFVTVDNLVITDEVPTLENIVGEVIDTFVSDTDRENDSADESTEFTPPSITETCEALSTIKCYVQFNNLSKELTESVLFIERKLEQEYIQNKCMKQSTMPEYFAKIQQKE